MSNKQKQEIMKTLNILTAQLSKELTVKFWGIVQDCYTSGRISFNEFCQLTKQIESKGFFNI
jgi:hypothetical protein